MDDSKAGNADLPVGEEALERESSRLRRLARGLLYERHGAEDVVQEAWLATLEGGGQTVQTTVWSARGWLAGFVRNRAREKNREQGRRRWREERAAASRSRPVPPTVDALARIETMRRVVDGVEALAEPYRTVLLLRFFDDLPPREIAAKTGVSVNTVRSQLQRGLTRLRGELDDGTEEGRASLLGVLVPLAGPAPAGVVFEPSSASRVRRPPRSFPWPEPSS